MKLQLLHEALAQGLKVGALIHEKTAVAHRVEVLAVEDQRLLGLATVGDDERLFRPGARVRVELPRDASVIHVPGRVTGCRPGDGPLEMEIACEAAEERQRRADARVAADCRLRLRDGGVWEGTRTVNVSAGGVLVANGGSTHAGDLVDVEVDLFEQTIRCRAEVVRRGVKTGGVSSRINAALRFIELPEEQRERLALHVLSVHAREKAAAARAHR